jgi:hypothetical protein
MGVDVDGLVLGLALVHERLDQPARPVDLEAGDADGELLAIGRMKDEAVAPADPEIELVDHSPRWRGSTSGQMLGLGVEPEDQLRWLLHDALADNENPTVKQPRQSRQVTDRPVCSQAR